MYKFKNDKIPININIYIKKNVIKKKGINDFIHLSIYINF